MGITMERCNDVPGGLHGLTHNQCDVIQRIRNATSSLNLSLSLSLSLSLLSALSVAHSPNTTLTHIQASSMQRSNLHTHMIANQTHRYGERQYKRERDRPSETEREKERLCLLARVCVREGGIGHRHFLVVQKLHPTRFNSSSVRAIRR